MTDYLRVDQTNITITLTPSATVKKGTPSHLVGDNSKGFGLGGGGVISSIEPGITSVVSIPAYSFGGEGEVSQTKPLHTQLVGKLFLVMGGGGSVTAAKPGRKSFVGTGGLVLQGLGVVTQVSPNALPYTSLVGSGGIFLGGAGVILVNRPTRKSLIGTGGFLCGDFRLPPITVFRPGSNRVTVGQTALFNLGGQGAWSQSRPGTFSIVTRGAALNLSGAGVFIFKMAPITRFVGKGGFVFSGGEDLTIFDVWVLSGNNFEPSYYAGFDFNSFAQFRGQFYGAKVDGIYLLGGESDDGQEIHSGLRIITNFNTEKDKRLRGIKLGRCGEDAKIRVKVEGGKAGFFIPDVTHRAVVSRNLQGKQFTLDISDFEALSQLEITVLSLVK
jgi:hypothetical protein